MPNSRGDGDVPRGEIREHRSDEHVRRRYGYFLADQDRLRNRSHGIINHSVGLLRSMAGLLADDERIVVYCNPSIAAEIDWDQHPGLVQRILSTPSSPFHRLWMENIGIQLRYRRDQLDVIHFPKGFIPLVRKPGGPFTIASIMDDIPVQYLKGSFGSRRPLLKNAYVSGRLLVSARSADAVTTISEFSGQALERFGRRPVTTGIGIDAPATTPTAIRERTREVVAFVSPLPHKRSDQLLELLRNSEVVRSMSLSTEMIGVAPSEASPPPGSRQFLYLAPDELGALIGRARAVVCCSSYEGFGLPPVEAWAAGTPAVYPLIEPIRTNLSGIPGGYEMGVEGSFDAALRSVLELDDAELARFAGMVQDRFRWLPVAERTLAIYRSAVHGTLA